MITRTFLSNTMIRPSLFRVKILNLDSEEYVLITSSLSVVKF